VYLKTSDRQPVGTVEWMKRELGPLMASAGYRVEWMDRQTIIGASGVEALVVVELQGSCGMPFGMVPAGAPFAGANSLHSLASTTVTDGHVLPFAMVNCANLSRALGPALIPEGGARRDFLYGRAMARVLAHELYHIIVGTPDHTAEGVSKPSFTMGELTSERFEFETAVLAKFRQALPEHPVDTSPEVSADTPATGR
jgi:hypothetical protein